MAAVLLARFAMPAPAHATAVPPPAPGDWPRFGWDAGRTNVFTAGTGVTAANLASLASQQVPMPAAVDSSAIYLRGVPVGGATRDVFVVTTAYGRTLALDAANGSVLWSFAPAGIAGWEGGKQITEASPVADPERQFVYTAAGDGKIHKLALGNGSEVLTGGWPVAVTRDPAHEKIGAALNLAGRWVIAATTSYADGKPYQGHVVTIDRGTGVFGGIFNVLCAQRHALQDPRSCPHAGGAIWGRGGVVVEPNGALLAATANGPRAGRTDWGESLIELTPDARRVKRSWTPSDHARLDRLDLDLGSAAPALLPYRGRLLALLGSKDGTLRLLDVRRLGRGRSGGLLQTFAATGHGSLRTAPAVWVNNGAVTAFVGNNAAVTAYRVGGGAHPRLTVAWRFGAGATSPVMAGGLLYAFDQLHGVLNVLDPATGRRLRALPALPGHWQSPIVSDGRIALGSGNANLHQRNGTLLIYRLPR